MAIAPLGYGSREHPAISRIGVAYDAEPEAVRALGLATDLARTLHAELRLVSVIPLLDLALRPERIGPTEDRYREIIRNRFERLLADAVEQMPTDVQVDSVLLEGMPAKDIADQGVELDLLVMGSRGYGPIRRTLLGGVAREVVTLSPCPVMVLPRSAGEGGSGSRPAHDGASVNI